MVNMVQFWDIVIRGFFGAGVATLGFAVLFNLRGKALFFASAVGGLGGLAYNFCFYMLGWNAAISNFFGAVALTIGAEICARRLKMTVTTFLAGALIPLVPGGDAYRMMYAFMQDTVYPGLQYLLTTMTIAGMLALGILMVSALTRLFFYSRRKVVQATRMTASYLTAADRRRKQSSLVSSSTHDGKREEKIAEKQK